MVSCAHELFELQIQNGFLFSASRANIPKGTVIRVIAIANIAQKLNLSNVSLGDNFR